MTSDDGAFASKAPAIGIYGGTFDPIHIGHLMIADEVAGRLALDRVIFVPARVSPLKTRGNTLFSAEERARLVACAIADNPLFELSYLDLHRSGPSFTYDTLRLFREQLGAEASLYFIMGMDSLVHFGLWRHPERILNLARLAVVTRPGVALDWAALQTRMPNIREQTDLIETLQIGISSTEIRQRLQTGLPYRYQLPAAVYEAIQEMTRAEQPSER